MAWTTPGSVDEQAGEQVTVVPANQASWADLAAIFGDRGQPAHCFCQWFKVRDKDWKAIPDDEHAARLHEQTHCGEPDAPRTSGLVAYLDGEPAGWCAVEPRTEYLRLRYLRVPWAGRDEDRSDPGVWAVTCFVTRPGFRKRGVSRALAAAAASFAQERGARAVEGYSLILRTGQQAMWGELYVGKRSIFADAGYREVSRTTRRAVMRIDFDPATDAVPGSDTGTESQGDGA